MTTEYDPKKDKELEVEEEVKRYRIVITSTNVKTAELLISRLTRKVEELSEDSNIRCNGPARLPRKTLNICVRKSPCGNGTETFDKFEMRIFKRVITLWSSYSKFQDVINGLGSEADVIVEATCFDDEEED